MVQCPSPALRLYCKLQHRNTVKCQATVVKGDEWREANMQLFLIESAQSGSLTVLRSGLNQDHLWCWLKKGASSAGTQGEHCSICLHISKELDIIKHLIAEKKSINGIYGFDLDGVKSCSSDFL